jgi:hypothetical protein
LPSVAPSSPHNSSGKLILCSALLNKNVLL